MMTIDFLQPVMLILLPLAALPMLRRRSDALAFSNLAWLPVDRVGGALSWLWRALGVLALASLVVGLAGPGQSGAQIPRTGRGAEVLILLDRSSSMDNVIRPWNASGGGLEVGDSKGKIVRDLLAQFVTKRQDDRFALITFSTRPMTTVPFTERREVVLAGLTAAGIGRGLPDTDMGSALLMAIRQFEGRTYSGSRVVLIASDGGAQLDAPTRLKIEAGLARQRVGVYWIYIRTSHNSADLKGLTADADESVEEVALHRFFSKLATPYRLYQTDDAGAMAAAVAEIDRQQNQPLSFLERVPRRDHSGALFTIALMSCVTLLGWRSIEVRDWR